MERPKFQFNWFDLPDQQRLISEAIQFQFSQTQYFSPAQLSILQFSNVKQLLSHCLENVPYYQKGKYKNIENWNDWKALPILSRIDVQQFSKELRAKNDLSKSDGRTQEMRSSGSTGRPIEVLTSEKAGIFWNAITVRDHLWQKKDFSKSLAVIKYFDAGRALPPGLESTKWGPATAQLFATGPAYSLNSSVDIDTQLAWLKEKKPSYLITYPSLIKALAQKNLVTSDPIHFDGVTTIGEVLSRDVRELVHQAFGCKISDLYSCQELGYLAIQCPKHDHYHVQSETAIVEILDDDNNPCPPGEMGRIIVTPLRNYVMPLLRYEVGDYAIAGGTCDCGITLPVIKKIIGRTRNLVTYPNGRKSWPSYNPMKLMDLLPNAQFQLVQKTLNTLLLRIGYTNKEEDIPIDKLVNIINSAMGHDFEIDIEVMDTIPRSKSGKYEEFISELKSV